MSPPSRRWTIQTISCMLLAGTAGCVSSSSDFTESTTTTEASTSHQPTTSSTPTETPSTTVSPEKVTPYNELSEAKKRAFRTALVDGSVEVPADRPASSLNDVEYVRYEGDVYKLLWKMGNAIAEYTLTTSPITNSEVEYESELVAFEDLTTEEKTGFERVLDGGEYTVRDELLPAQLRKNKYVKHQGKYYKLNVAVGDVPTGILTVTRVS